MAIRVILVPLLGDERDRSPLAAAFDLGGRLRAHVEGLFIEPDPADVISTLGLRPPSDVVDRISRETQHETARRRQLVEDEFRAICAEARADTNAAPRRADRLSARWRSLMGGRHHLIGHEGRYSDLIVFSLGRVGVDREIRYAFEQALLNTGRPLLLVPASPPSPVGETVAIAWDGSVAAARSVTSALPLLRTAATIHVLTVESPPTRSDDLGRLGDYLAWHGISSQPHHIVAGDGNISAQVLTAAEKLEPDLLVMGGYGHNPRRDLTLGSVTYHILNCSNLRSAVFMAH